jgi:serine/threonine protein kinase
MVLNARACLQGQHVVAVMELCHTDLHAVLCRSHVALPPSIVKRLMMDLLHGVHAMHSHGALSLPIVDATYAIII